MTPKIFLGPMTLHVVEAIKELDLPIGLIPSRRQVEYSRGYTGLTTEELYNSVHGSNILLCRDHAGPGQGAVDDDGLTSLQEDLKYMDIVHIDPWKKASSLQDGIDQTIRLIEYCLDINPTQKFEIGTEQAIYEYSPEDLEIILLHLSSSLQEKFANIKYACVQSGTGLDLPGRKNIRNFNSNKLKAFIDVCNKYGVKSKEHNGDYLVDTFGIATRFELGLDAINIAPELGQLETECYLYLIGDDRELFDKFYNICYESRKWEKWITREVTKHELILTAGHYIIGTPEFETEIKDKLSDPSNTSRYIKDRLKDLIVKMYLQAHGYKA